jgi:outer membrane protein assembly factor BamB
MPVSKLQDALRIGLATVSELWHYNAKNWVTSVHADDIDDDGDIEVISGSRDGRVRAFTRRGDPRWERIIGNKVWVGTLVTIPQSSSPHARIIVGTRDGKIYLLDKDGKTIDPDGKIHAFNRSTGYALEREREQAAYWFKCDQVIRQVTVMPGSPLTVVAASENRCVYALDCETGHIRWQFQTRGWVRAVFCYDIDGDGRVETLAGSGDNHLYILDADGRCIQQHALERKIYALFAADIDQDGQVEILLSTDGKDLVVLAADLSEKWTRSFPNRLLTLQVVDIDNDGQLEIIAGSEDKHLYFLDHQGNLLWRHNLNYRIFSIQALDIDSDGVFEVVAGTEDNRVHVFRVRLDRELIKRIRRFYQGVKRSSPESLKALSPAERSLLFDLLNEQAEQPTSTPHKLVQALQLIEAGNYYSALKELLHLEHDKVQQLWCQEKVGHIRALYQGDIVGDSRREVIIGTREGFVRAFDSSGKSLWSRRTGGAVVALQTGYLEGRRWQDILVCSSDHHIYTINGVQKTIKPSSYVDEWMSCFSLLSAGKKRQIEVVVGTEDRKLCFYNSDFSALTRETILTPQGIRIVCAYHAPQQAHERVPAIIAGSLENGVYGYSRSGTLLWSYKTADRVLSVHVQDLDGDGMDEIIVGSEDCNVHVLNSQGVLLWRYYTPHRVLTVHAYDINQDGQQEILLGCGDGYLYVLNASGDVLWRYQANDRIRVVRAEDIDQDGHVEIVLGSEDRLELLRVLDETSLHSLIVQCWLILQKQESSDKLIGRLLHHDDPYLRSFALQQLAAQDDFSLASSTLLETFLKDPAIQVRQTLIDLLLQHYNDSPMHALQLLNQLSTSQERDLRLHFVEHLQPLLLLDPDRYFDFLERFMRNIDRHVRRAVVRQLHQSMTITHQYMQGQIISLLLRSARDSDSVWVKQEAARALARFLDIYEDQLITYIYQLFLKEVEPEILDHIASHSGNPFIQQLFVALAHLKTATSKTAIDAVERVVKALERMKTLQYGKDLWLLYHEIQCLLGLQTIEEVANYQCNLTSDMFSAHEHAHAVLETISRLSTISRNLRIYLRRTDSRDRLNSLLEASSAIETIPQLIERIYMVNLYDEPLIHLPDYRLFTFILKSWQALIKEQLSKLSGRSRLIASLQTRSALQDKVVEVLLLLHNQGHSSAHNVKVTLLSSEDFQLTNRNSLEVGHLLPNEESEVTFTIHPRVAALKLVFEIVFYDKVELKDPESVMKMILYSEQLTLEAPRQGWRKIPNPYSTGTPTLDPKMFYGRKKDLEFLRDTLGRSSAKSMVVLYGQRRSGKTTLLRHMTSVPVLGEYIPLFIDMQRESYKITIDRFLYRIAYHLNRVLLKKGIVVEPPDAKAFADDATFAFDLFLDEVEEYLDGQKIILLIDEFEVLEEQVKKGKLEEEIFTYLRSLIQNRQSMNFLLAGTHKIEQLTKGYWSVFFNMARHYRLSRLDTEDAENLITKPVADFVEYEPHAVSRICHLTGNQPYLIHLVCRSLIDYCNEQGKAYVTLYDVNAVQEEVMQTGRIHFDWIWDQIEPEERIALSVLAEARKEEKRLISLPEIEEIYHHNHLLFKRERVTAAIKKLVEADVVETVGDTGSLRYRIAVGLISKWLRQERPLDLIYK